MPSSSRRVPQVAEVEDYDSDESSAKPGTRVRATRRTSSVRPTQRRDTASDSGYSGSSSRSGTANVAAQTQNAIAGSSSARQPAPTNTSGNKPVIHTSDRRPDDTRAPTRSASVSRPSNTERRYTLPQQEYAQQYAAWAAKYPEAAAEHRSRLQQQQQQQQQQYQSQQTKATPAPAVSNFTSQPRARAPSTSQPTRPVSIHGYGIPSVSNTVHHGPPPSPSAYQNNLAAYYQRYQQQLYQQPTALLGSTPPTQVIPAYPVQSPIATSPTSPNYGAMPAMQQDYSRYSARANANIAGLTYDLAKVTMAPQPTLARTMSARQTSGSYMPGAYPEPEAVESESESEESEVDSSEDERHRARKHKRDSKLMPPPSRRPSIHTRSTAPVAVTSRSSRQSIQRAPRSDTAVDYPSDHFDSDRTARTARAAVGRPRTESSFSSRSRRPSISTASSGRTKATTVSDGSGTRKVIVEDKYGRRRTAYLSQDQQDTLARQYERERREDEEKQERIEAYQQRVRGPVPTEFTADNIRQAAKRTSGSHVSRDSRKSGSSKASKPDGIKIQAGDTVLHVYGEANIEMHPGEDGGPAVFKIGNSTSGRDSAYYGSSKSGSRLSKRKETRQLDGYEEAL